MFKVKHVLKCFAGSGPYLISFQSWCESTELDPACVWLVVVWDSSDPPLFQSCMSEITVCLFLELPAALYKKQTTKKATIKK